jgi:hypothetical protein
LGDEESLGFVLESKADDVDLRSQSGGLDLGNFRSLGRAIVCGRMIEASSALPLPYVENLTVTRIDEQVDVMSQTVGKRAGDGFRLREGHPENDLS